MTTRDATALVLEVREITMAGIRVQDASVRLDLRDGTSVRVPAPGFRRGLQGRANRPRA